MTTKGARPPRPAWLRWTLRTGITIAVLVALWELPWYPHGPRCSNHDYRESRTEPPEWLGRDLYDGVWFTIDGSLSEPYAEEFTDLLRRWNTTALPSVRFVRLGRLVLLRPADEFFDPTDDILNGSFKTLSALGNPEWNDGWPQYPAEKRAAIQAFAERGIDGAWCPFARVLAIHGYVP